MIDVEWYRKNTNKSPNCPHYINSDKEYNPDGWKFCTQCGETCNKCGNPQVMYWCPVCESNQEKEGDCENCLYGTKEHNPVSLDNFYHKDCNAPTVTIKKV